MKIELIPLTLADLRDIYVRHVTDLLGEPPSIEDWYRFEQAVIDASPVQARDIVGLERERLLASFKKDVH